MAKKKKKKSASRTSPRKKKKSSKRGATSATDASQNSSDDSTGSSGETTKPSDQGLARAADDLLFDADDQGEPIETKAARPHGKIGRPSNEDLRQREREAKKAAERERDDDRALELFNKLMGLAAKMPVEGISKKIGGGMGVDSDETELVAEAAELWIKHRVGLVIEGEKLYDYLFFGALAFVFGRRLLAWAIVSRLKRKAPGLVNPNDDDNTGDQTLREVHAGPVPGAPAQTPLNN